MKLNNALVLFVLFLTFAAFAACESKSADVKPDEGATSEKAVDAPAATEADAGAKAPATKGDAGKSGK